MTSALDNPNALATLDKSYLWHPFTQMREWCAGEPVIIAGGEGRKLVDVKGQSYYDGVSSLWVNVHGHRVAAIDQAIRDQLARIAHSTFLGLSNVPAIRLAEQLIATAPAGLSRVFYSDSGSEAVEIGLKIAYQYWQLKGEKQRTAFIAMTDAYHGDTLGATSVGGIDLFHSLYRHLLFPVHRVPYPHPYRFVGSPEECSRYCLDQLDKLLAEHHDLIAGLIVEPEVQGAAGMIMMPAGFMKSVADRCRHHGILLLTDEVATGFGRTGRMFACNHAEVTPDIMMVAKGLTGGYLPLAATLTSESIYEAFLGDYSEKKTFFHGHSYTGNQLGCAAAMANLKLIADTNLIDKVARQSKLIQSALKPVSAFDFVGDIRIKGFMVGIELVKDKESKEPFPWEERMGVKVCERSRELGMILRPLGNVVIFMPPLGSTDQELGEMLTILVQAIADVTGQ